MIHVDEINPEFEQEVEFLNLSNLALSCPRSKAYIDGLKKPGLEPTDEVDRCNAISPPTPHEFPNTCEEDPDCFRHIEKTMFVCSSKSRRFEYADVEMFRHRHLIRPIQRYTQMWCIEKDSVSMDLFFVSPNGNLVPVIMYCRVIQSKRTKIVYVVFSSGIVFSGPDVLVKLRDYSLQIIQQVTRMVEKGTRICLCGHSMGATVSMAVAYHWFYEDRNYFMEHVNVVALGSINLFEREPEFKHLPNVRSYLSATSTHQGIFVDPFCMRGDRSKMMYSPVKLILSELVEVDVNDIRGTADSITVSSSVPFEVSSSYSGLHSLDDVYIPTLLQLCKQKRGGRSRKKGIPNMGNSFFKYFNTFRIKSDGSKVNRTNRRKLSYKDSEYNGIDGGRHVKKNRYSRKWIR